MSRLLLIPFLFFHIILNGQTKKIIDFADRSFENKDYYGAAHYYLKAFKQDSSNLEVFNKYATSQRLDNNYKSAIRAYRYYSKSNLQNTYPEYLFYIGLMFEYLGTYDKAENHFIKFIKNASSKSSNLYHQAVRHVEISNWAYNNRYKFSNQEVNNLKAPINSELSEFSCTMLNDTTLLYSALHYDSLIGNVVENEHPYSRLKIAIEKDGKWELLDSIIHFGMVKKHITNPSFNQSLNKLYFSVCESGNCKIFVSTLENNQFQEPKEVTIKNEGESTNTQPFSYVLDSTEYLLFSSNRKGGHGGMDLWLGEIDGLKLKKIKNLGDKINTIGNEVCPTYVSDSSALFFSSDWHIGFGGFDIFKSYQSVDSFETPINLMLGINSSTNDIYFSPDFKNLRAFASSNRMGGLGTKNENCCNDIYEVKYSEQKQKIELITDESIDSLVSNKQLLNKGSAEFVLYFPNDFPNPNSNDTTTSTNYSDVLKIWDEPFISEHLELTAILESQLSTYKEYNSYCQKLTDSLHSIEIFLEGYSSALWNSNYNYNLSKRRIESVVNDICTKTKLPPSSIVWHKSAFGESNSVASDDSDDTNQSVFGMQAFKDRRVEIKIRIVY